MPKGDVATAGERGMIVQVDRVASVEEAMAFRDAGADLMSVALDPDRASRMPGSCRLRLRD